MIKVTTANTQQAKDAIKKALQEFAPEKYLTIGIHEGEGNHEGTDQTQAQIGAKLHFGSPSDHIPPRPWLDVGVQSGNKAYLDVIENGIEDGATPDDMLEIVGNIAEAAVKQYMVDLRSPPNAPSTIARKGSDNPLVDTGSLVGSVKYKIQSGEPTEGLE